MTEADLLDMARAVTGRYLRTHPLPHSYRDDVLSDACWGAAQAAASHNPALGASLTTHAYNRARGAILDGIRDRSPLSRTAHAHGIPIPRSPLSLEQMAETGRQPHTAGSMEETVADTDLLHRMLATCTARERVVLIGSLVHGYPLADIADELGVTECRVGQIRRAVLARLRAQFQDAA